MKYNYIIEWRYFISSIAKSTDNNSNAFAAAKTEEQKSIEFAAMRTKAAVRNLKQSIKNIFKGGAK